MSSLAEKLHLAYEEITALRAENKRLRAALRDLLKVAEKWPMTAEYLAKIISADDGAALEGK